MKPVFIVRGEAVPAPGSLRKDNWAVKVFTKGSEAEKFLDMCNLELVKRGFQGPMMAKDDGRSEFIHPHDPHCVTSPGGTIYYLELSVLAE